MSEFIQSDKYALGDFLIDANDYALIDIVKGHNVFLGLWNKLNYHVKLVNLLKNDMDGVAPDINGLGKENSSANKVIWAVFPGDLEVVHNDNKADTNHPYLAFLQNFQIDPDGNPILFIYNMKPSLDF